VNVVPTHTGRTGSCRRGVREAPSQVDRRRLDPTQRAPRFASAGEELCSRRNGAAGAALAALPHRALGVAQDGERDQTRKSQILHTGV
jgi:hypothetical protein